MDLDPYTICTLPNKIGTFVQWTVENLEGSKWNSFNLMMSTDIRSWIFKVEGWFDKQSNSIPLYTHDGTTIFSRTKTVEGACGSGVVPILPLANYGRVYYISSDQFDECGVLYGNGQGVSWNWSVSFRLGGTDFSFSMPC